MRSLSSLGQESLRYFDGLADALSHADARFVEQLPPPTLENERQRFRLWSTNLGLLQPGHASLDYRLQDANSAREYTEELLEDLNEYLTERKCIESCSI